MRYAVKKILENEPIMSQNKSYENVSRRGIVTDPLVVLTFNKTFASEQNLT